MKKKCLGMLLAFCLFACTGMEVRADDLYGQSGWKVTLDRKSVV